MSKKVVIISSSLRKDGKSDILSDTVEDSVYELS